MIKKALEYLVGLKRPETLCIGDLDYVQSGYERVLFPEPRPVKAHTLNGLIQFVIYHENDLQFSKPIIHILDPIEVQVISALHAKTRSRGYLCGATITGNSFSFGKYFSLEEFVVGIKSLFVQDDNTALVLKKVGTITQDAKAVTLDDGISQSTTARKGIAGMENIVIPTLITLRPYRTFREVEQPASEFVLRIKAGDSFPMVALFEADGGMWELEAIKNIAMWLSETTKGKYTIIA